MKRSIKRWLFFTLHLLGFALLWLVLRDLQWKDFLKELSSYPAWKYGLGLVLLCLVYLSKSYRWHRLNAAFGINTSWRSALVFYLAAGFLSVITPGRLGEFAKVFFLKRKYGIDTPAAASSVVLDRIWDVLVLSLFASLSMALLFSGPDGSLLSLLLMGAFFILSLLLVLVPAIFFKPILKITAPFKRLQSRLEEIFILWNTKRYHNFFGTLLITLLSYVALFIIPLIFASGTNFPIQFKDGVGAVSIANILSFIPVSIAGFGTRELVFSEVWKLSLYPKEVAISISTCYFIVTYLGSLLMGGLVYLFNLKSLYRPSELRKMKAEKSD